MALHGQDLRFQHITRDHGLSDNAITCLFEDTDGTLLIGSESGVDRFDGTTVRRLQDVQGHATAITRDRQGMLWVATLSSGLVRMEPGAPVHVFPPNDDSPGALAVDQLTALHDLNDSTLLIGSQNTVLVLLDKRTLQFTYWTGGYTLANARKAVKSNGTGGWCHSIVPLDQEHLWIGLLHSFNSLLVHRRTGSVTWLALESEGAESYTAATTMNDRLLLGGWQNRLDTLVHWRSLKGDSIVHPLSGITLPDEPLCLLEWDEHHVLVGTRMAGLVLVDVVTGGQRRFVRKRTDGHSLPSDRIRCLLKTSSGIIWVGTSLGLAYHDPGNWRMHTIDLREPSMPETPEIFFHRIDPLSDGGAHIFTSEGRFTWRGESGRPPLERIEHDGRNLQATVNGTDHDGTPMLGTEYGVFRAHAGGWRAEERVPYYARTGAMYQVRAIQTDTLNGRAVRLFATLGNGVNVIDARTGEDLGFGMPRGMATRVDRYLVNSAVRTAGGTYWYATNSGIGRWDPENGTLTTGLDDARRNGGDEGMLLPEENVRQLLYINDTVWALAAHSGVHAVIGTACSPAIALPPGARAHGFTRDRSGRFWITTNDGLLRGEAFRDRTVRVPINDDHDIRKLTRAITTLANGRVALCADDHLITFDPKDLDVLPLIPEPVVVAAYVADQRMPVLHGSVELSYRASVIDIALSAVQRDGVRPLLFQYRLDGVENAWRTARPVEQLHYAGVPVGVHVLLVRVVDAFGRIGPEYRVLTIAVAAPFWQAWWFYASIAAAVSMATYAWSRYRIAQAMKLQTVRNRIASDLHDEVGSSLSSITIGSQLAASLSPTENEQLHHLLARIGETSAESLRSISDIVWAIDPKNDEGEALVNRMRRIASELLETKGIDVSFNVSGGVEELQLPMNARKELVLLYKEAVHNASKYSGANTVQVSLHQRNGTLNLSVKDDGRGFDPALHLDGHGLGSMARRAAQLGGRFTLTSAPGMGVLVGVEVDVTRIRD